MNADDSQQRTALDLANQVRTAGSVFRRELRLMDRDQAARIAARVIARGANGGLSAQYVDQVLRAVPGFGPKRVQELLKDTEMVYTGRIEDLLTHAPISMHDLYPPEKYPGLYA
jgi:hypothetical protein